MVCSLKQPFKAAAPALGWCWGRRPLGWQSGKGVPISRARLVGRQSELGDPLLPQRKSQEGRGFCPLSAPWSWGMRQRQEDWAHTDHSHLLLSFSAAPALLPSQIPSPALTTPGGRNHHYLSDRQVPNAPRHTLTQGHGGKAVLHLAPHPSSRAGCCLTGEPRPGCRWLLLRSASRDPAKLVASRAGPGASTL